MTMIRKMIDNYTM